MPTGYTANMYEGKDETFEEFVLHCARAIGYFVRQRDNDPNEPPLMAEVSPYQISSLRKAYRDYLLFARKSDEELRADWEKSEADSKADQERRNEKYRAMRLRYECRLADVEAWEITPDLQGLKDFMVEQINSSIKFDCHEREFVPKPYEQWLEDESYARYRWWQSSRKYLKEEIERVKVQNEATKNLYRALGLPVPEDRV